MRHYIRCSLLASVASCLAAPALAAPVATTPAAAPVVTADTDKPAADVDQQTSSAGQAGQANDKQSLTSSDIIVIGSQSAQDAPVSVSLTTTQPQAAVSREYIDNANAGSDFFSLIALTPGVSLTGNNNGAGFTETKAQIRGFQDGEYNVTYDSIPFADTNNPTHHSTSFFPSNTIETIVVDRGPGNASQLGQATYGGNINLYSRAVSDATGIEADLIGGSFNSFIGRLTLQSGKVAGLGDAKFVVSGQYLRSDGALSYSPVEDKNLFVKAVIPIGSRNTLTLLATYNRNYYYQSDVQKGSTCGGFTAAAPAAPGSTLTINNCSPTSDIGRFGLNYGLSNDPTRTDYFGYNRTDKNTDFEIVRLQSELGSGFSMDNRLYTYQYSNQTFSGNGLATVSTVGGVTTFTQNKGKIYTGFSGAGTAASPYVRITGPATDIQGYDKLNSYRNYGYIGQINYEFSMGKVRVGAWYEHSDSDRHTYDLDRTTGRPSYNENFNNGNGTAAQSALPGIGLADIAYDQQSNWDQYQLFGEFEFRPVSTLSITPGVKYIHFTRGISALVNQKARSPLNTNATWTQTLPFATVNWQVMPNWAFYGQYAKGFYVPDLSSFYSSSASLGTSLSNLQPQTTTNYQIGTVWHGSRVSIDADGYIINVSNKIGTCNTVGCDTSLLINIGQVRYKGVEGGITVSPFRGLTVFGNASYNEARSVTSGAQVAKAPFSTAAIGAIYSSGGLRASFSQKFTGPSYATEYSGAGPRNYRIAPYSLGEFAISYQFLKNFRLGATVSNVFDDRSIYAIAAGKTYGVDDQFNVNAPRQVLVTLRVTY
ncbi:MAG: TonB-dependent receptor [Sphingomonas sp. 28-66-16]|nr:MAG: TonB-dependent receptor [Sphingomonas sp. 28-66-16]